MTNCCRAATRSDIALVDRLQTTATDVHARCGGSAATLEEALDRLTTLELQAFGISAPGDPSGDAGAAFAGYA
jgi:hypothetical protein